MAGPVCEGVSATFLVRNFSTVLDEVRMSGTSVDITKGNRAVARLMPPQKSGLPISQLADFLALLPELGEDTGAFKDDIQQIKEAAQLPDSVWES